MVVREDLTLAQLERILHSDTFRNSDVLRRLLRFLADKSISGEADRLKEYIIGIDALGKPSSYDPRQDSLVRIQVGRLRQKLAEYYRTEGKDDPFVVELPKGRFKLHCDPRPEPPAPEIVLDPVIVPGVKPKSFDWRRVAFVTVAALAMAVGWGNYEAVQLGSCATGRGARCQRSATRRLDRGPARAVETIPGA
jgi:hypothetical protein